MSGQGSYLYHEVLDSEQWLGRGWTAWQVIDPSKTTMENSRGIVHQTVWVPVLKKTRCRLWARFHGYGWLGVKS